MLSLPSTARIMIFRPAIEKWKSWKNSLIILKFNKKQPATPPPKKKVQKNKTKKHLLKKYNFC